MADDKRSRLKRESSQSRKEVKITTSKERKPALSRENTIKTKPSTISTSKSTTQKSIKSTVTTTKSASQKTVDSSKKSTVTPRTTVKKPATTVEIKRKEPVISGSQRKSTTRATDVNEKKTVQKSLSRKVNLPETTVKSKVIASTRGKTESKAEKARVTIKDNGASDKKVTKNVAASSRTESRSASRLSRDRTRTRTLSPGESKLLKLHAAVQGKQTETSKPEPSEEEVDDYYESDFESDFESPSSSSEEQSTSSSEEAEKEEERVGGAREMSSATINTSTTLAAAIVQHSSHPSAPPPRVTPKVTSSPQIQLDHKTVETRKSEQVKAAARKEATVQQAPTINFALARQRQAKLQAMERARSRGAELLSMIKLDTVNFTLFNLPPSKYEVLMTSFGKLNATQVQIQTGDGKLEEEVQTEETSKCDHWTQHPPCIIKHDASLQGLQAFGPKEDLDSDLWPKVDYNRLEKFLSRATEMVLAVMSEESSTTSEGSLTSLGLGLGLQDLAETGVTLGTHISLLLERNVTLLQFGDHAKVLSVHTPSNKTEDIVLRQDLICVWSMTRSEYPRHVLGSRGTVTSVCLHQSWPFLVFAGIDSGAVCIWDLQEASHYHPSIVIDNTKTCIRTPTFSTALLSDAHQGSIVQISPLTSGQLVSVDDTGVMVTWSVLKLTSGDLGAQTAWGNYQMVLSAVNKITSDPDELEVCDMAVIGDRILVALDSGIVKSISTLQPSTRAARNFAPTEGTTSLQGFSTISTCPYNSQHFVVLYNNGATRLYNLKNTAPLWTSPLYDMGISIAIQSCWGKCGLILLLSSRLHLQLWDLTTNSSKPKLVCKLDKEIVKITASRFTNQIGVSTIDGHLHVISLKSELCREKNSQEIEYATHFGG